MMEQALSNSLFLLVLFQFCSGAEAVLLEVLKGIMNALIPLYFVARAYFFALVLSFYFVKIFGFGGMWICLICGVSAIIMESSFCALEGLQKQQI